MVEYPCLEAKCNAECCKQQILLPVSIYDIFNAAKHKKMTAQAFFNKYCGTATQGKLVYFVIDLTDKECIFLKNNKCQIYQDRPIICRTTLECENVKAFYGSLENFKKIAPHNCFIQNWKTIPKYSNEKLEKRVDLEIAAIETARYAKKHGDFEEKTARETFERIERKMNSSFHRTYVKTQMKAEDKLLELLWWLRLHIITKK